MREPSAIALERVGYAVVQAVSWQEALALTHQLHPKVDLIVTDLVMPDEGGVGVFSRLRSAHGAIPVIVFSAYPRVMRFLDGVLEGVVEWLEKPLDVTMIVDAVGRAMQMSGGSRSNTALNLRGTGPAAAETSKGVKP